MKLELVGPIGISIDGKYSEDTTVRVTAVRTETGTTLTNFTGTVEIAEAGTSIYSQNGGTLPASVSIASGGTVTFVANSLAGPKFEGAAGAKPDDAMIQTTNYPVYGGSSLAIRQWIISGTQIDAKATCQVFDWVQTRTRDIFASATGDVSVVLSAISSYTVAVERDDAAGHTSPGGVVSISPYFMDSRLDSKSLGNYGFAHTQKFFTAIFLHEARHAYQLQISTPSNDNDGDRLVRTVTVAPTNVIVDSLDARTVCNQSTSTTEQRSYKGDSNPDAWESPDWASRAWEMDAWKFTSVHAQ